MIDKEIPVRVRAGGDARIRCKDSPKPSIPGALYVRNDEKGKSFNHRGGWKPVLHISTLIVGESWLRWKGMGLTAMATQQMLT